MRAGSAGEGDVVMSDTAHTKIVTDSRSVAAAAAVSQYCRNAFMNATGSSECAASGTRRRRTSENELSLREVEQVRVAAR